VTCLMCQGGTVNDWVRFDLHPAKVRAKAG
jgi:hypothetical protein